jgi:hypothetical protein
MSQSDTSDEITVTVLRSRALGRADGRVAIWLETKELGPIAFEVDARAIAALRGDLAAAESLLRQSGAQKKPS